MKLFVVMFLMLFVLVLPYAQQPINSTTRQALYTDEDLRQLGTIGPMSAGARTIDLRYEGVKGNPFLFEDWQNAALQLRGQEGFGNEVSINIDGEKNQLYFQLPGGYSGVIPSDKIQALKILNDDGEQVFEVWPSKEVENAKDTTLKYYQSLYDGKFKLLKLTFKFFVKADYKGPYSTDTRYDEYKADNSYWLKEENGAFHKVKMKRKSLEQALPSYADKVQPLMKQNKISFQTEEDLVAFLKLLEQSK